MQESILRNRLIGEAGTKNDDFNFICIEQPGKRRAIIGSFSAHATTLDDVNMEISADYPGYWARSIEKTTSSIALFCAGSTGSQSPVGEGSGFDKSKFIGEALADSLIMHMKDIKLSDKDCFFSIVAQNGTSGISYAPYNKNKSHLIFKREINASSKKRLPASGKNWRFNLDNDSGRFQR